ncbi:4290_t:CDS:2 [Funneliformis caledonium]|uniref:4290_t:CDS:1 n=2 Tax=Funneliformis TaxID=1117308 RepID=A0A9N8VBB6_9GLOM|nr:4290_t:CDS:2 [Funneliformis caledonium]CAG8451585.1 8197_t:CDS:2 [Funneliformis mosseae]
MSEELTQDDPYELEINNLRAAENLGYDNVKFRPETERLHDDNGSAIFDIGDEHDDDDDFHSKWDDEQSTIRASHGGSSSSHEATTQRINDEENQDHIEQEISKLN